MGATVSIAAEYDLLLAALAPAAERPPPAGPVRWEEVLRLAAWHRLEPLLHRHLCAGAQAPEHVVRRVEGAYLTNAARNLHLRASLGRVLAALAAASVPAVPLKGAALVEAVYPDPALREMTDLDVLVPHETLDDANAALAAVGYRPALAVESVSGTAAWMRVHHHHDPPLVDHRRIAAVELHHNLLGQDRRAEFEVADLWRRARKVVGAPHLLPSGEDLLLHACLHFMFNRTGRTEGSLAQLADIAWIVDREEIDWSALTASARGYRLHAGVFLALFAARELGIALPDGSLEALRPPGFDARLGRRLVALRVLRTGPAFPVRSLRWMLAPSRGCLATGWNADPGNARSLARSYARRAIAQLPLIRSALGEPRTVIQDYRLNRQIESIGSRPLERPPVSLPAAPR